MRPFSKPTQYVLVTLLVVVGGSLAGRLLYLADRPEPETVTGSCPYKNGCFALEDQSAAIETAFAKDAWKVSYREARCEAQRNLLLAKIASATEEERYHQMSLLQYYRWQFLEADRSFEEIVSKRCDLPAHQHEVACAPHRFTVHPMNVMDSPCMQELHLGLLPVQ